MSRNPWAEKDDAKPAAPAPRFGSGQQPAFQQFPCAACGAKLTFKPGTSVIKCDHCGHENPIQVESESQSYRRERTFETALAELENEGAKEEKTIIHCNSCAAEFTVDEHKAADTCPFCGSAVVANTETRRVIQPQALVPFELDAKAAQEALQRWLGKLWFAPNDVVTYARTSGKLSGMYVPYWTYDSQTYSRYQGQRGDAYYVESKDSQGNTTRERRVRWTSVSGNVDRFFDDVLIVASHTLPKKYVDRMRTWRLESIQPYRSEFIAGFQSEIYQVDLKVGWEEARDIMKGVIHDDVRRDIGGDEQRVERIDTSFEDVRFKHILLPLWMAAFKYRGKSYRFVVNGQTGEVQGERPYSWIKITIAVVIGLVVLGGIIWLLSKGR